MNEKIYMEMKEHGTESWWFAVRSKIIRFFLQSYLKRKDQLRILDVGCGTGGLFKELSRYGKVWGMEIHRESAEFCERMGYQKVWNNPIEETCCTDQLFDVITCFDVLEHVEKDQEGLHQCFLRLKENGLLFLSVPAGEFFFSKNEEQYGHYRRYDYKKLSVILEKAGFTIEETAYFNLFLLIPIVAVRKFTDFLRLIKLAQKPVDEIVLPSFFEKLFKIIFSFEFMILKRKRLPYGLSLLVIARKDFKER